MSQYTDMKEIVELSLNYKLDTDVTHLSAMPYENTISVRGKDTDDWILLRNLDEGATEWIEMKDINITEALLSQGQRFSTSFQIKFTNDNDLAFALSNILLDTQEEFVLLPEQGEVFDKATATLVGGDVVLEWSLIEEEGSQYEIEVIENFNNSTFDVIGTINAERTTTQPFYTFTDVDPEQKGMRYYRIKQTNADGSVYFSPVLSVMIHEKQLDNVYPNPFQDRLSLVYNASERTTIQVLMLNQDGRIIQANQVDVNIGEQIIPIDVDTQYAAGIYFLKIIDGKKTTCQKIVKMDDQ